MNIYIYLIYLPVVKINTDKRLFENEEKFK